MIIFLFSGVDALKTQTKPPPPKPKVDAPSRIKASYDKARAMDDYPASKDTTQEPDSLSPPPGGGPGYSMGLADTGYSIGGDSRRISMTQSALPSEGSLQQLSRTDSLMGNAVDKSRGRSGRGGRGADQGYGPIPTNILNDRFDHYNRPPSRDRSVDRFASRGQTPVPQELINPRSRAPSAQRATAQDWTPDSGVFDEDVGVATGGSRRPSRPPSVLSSEAPQLTGNGSVGGGFNIPYQIPSTQTEAEVLLRQRACGQEIPPSYPTTPGGSSSVKRAESLYINPVVRRQAQVKVRFKLYSAYSLFSCVSYFLEIHRIYFGND